MTEQPDPFERLAASRPREFDAFLAPGDDPAADELVSTILTTSRLPRRRRRGLLAALTVVGVAGTGAVAAAVWLDRPSDPVSLSCYSNASNTPDEQVALLVDPDSTPIDQCAKVWREGPLGNDIAPPLAACVTANGIVAVIPGQPTVCDQLGLARLDPNASEGDDLAAQVINSLSATWPETCVTSIDDAVALVERVLDDVEATNWTITIAGPPTPNAPCVAASPDAEQVNVILAPIPPPPEP